MGNSMGLMGRLLGLEALVEGTIQKVGGQIRITPRLVDVHTGRLIWADSYEYPAAEWDRMEAGAAREIAGQVGAHLAIHGAFHDSGAR
jgi:TolB-like protein